MKPYLSVIIAAYNEEKTIEKLLQALKQQTLEKVSYEILLIDNNSTDRTVEIAKQFEVKVISYTEKQGAVFAKQCGAQNAQGEILVYLDADSIPNKDWLANIVDLLQDKKYVCIGGTMISLQHDPLSNIIFNFFDFFAQLNQLIGISLIWGSNMAVRKDAFIEVGGINTSLKTSDDWELILRLQKRFGIKSTLYTNKLRVKTVPRKQDKLSVLMPYVSIGIVNYFSVFLLRTSATFGKSANVR